MNKFRALTNSSTFWKWVAILVIAYGYIYFNYLPQRTNCQRIQTNRAEGHVRFSVQYNFMTSAASRVERQGNREISEGKSVAGLDDIHAAENYRAQRDRLTDLPDIKC